MYFAFEKDVINKVSVRAFFPNLHLSLNPKPIYLSTRYTRRYASRVQSRVKRRNWRNPRAIASLHLANEIIIKSSSPQSRSGGLASFSRCVAASRKGCNDATHARLTYTHVHVNCGRDIAGRRG